MPNLPTAPIVDGVMARLTAFRGASTFVDGIRAAMSAGGTRFLAGLSTPTSQVGGIGSITRGIEPVRAFQAWAGRVYGSSPAPAGLHFK